MNSSPRVLLGGLLLWWCSAAGVLQPCEAGHRKYATTEAPQTLYHEDLQSLYDEDRLLERFAQLMDTVVRRQVNVILAKMDVTCSAQQHRLNSGLDQLYRRLEAIEERIVSIQNSSLKNSSCLEGPVDQLFPVESNLIEDFDEDPDMTRHTDDYPRRNSSSGPQKESTDEDLDQLTDKFAESMQTIKFLNLSADQLKKLLASDRLNVSSELQVYEALISWVRYRPAHRLVHLEDLLGSVRLRLIDSNVLIFNIALDELLQNCTACQELVFEATRFQINPYLYPSRNVSALLNTTPRRWVSLNTSKPVTLQQGEEEPAQHNALLVIGGYDGREMLSSVLLYDLQRNLWKRAADLPQPRDESAAAVLNGQVYVCGGMGLTRSTSSLKTCVVYDPQKDSWTSSAPMLEERRRFGMATLQGSVYAVGGLDRKSVERYSLSTRSWSRVADFPYNTSYHAVTATQDSLCVVGVKFQNRIFNHLFKYDPQDDSWYRLASMSVPRYNMALTSHLGYLYAVGGTALADNHLDLVERYDPERDFWQPLTAASLPERRTSLGVQAVSLFGSTDRTIIYAVGGHNGDTVRSSGWRLAIPADENSTEMSSSSSSSSWVPIAEMPAGRYWHNMVSVQVQK